jgi:phenylpyruvate tautomerase PptA (4-oxalocrotonate tautomerase family)
VPIYECSAQKGLLTEDLKAKIAAAVTDVRVEATGAPPVFVHVFFNELPTGISNSAGEPDAKISGITGSIRAGLAPALAPPAVGPAGRTCTGRSEERP